MFSFISDLASYLAIVALVVFAHIIRFLSKLTKKGSGTSLPGLAIEKYFPSLIRPLTKKYSNIILITGTNGKTTTRSILNHLFRTSGESVCTNSGGANIYRGLASSLLFDFEILRNKPKSDNLILEVEEATLPRLTKYLVADYLILTNVFRDQLDAYSEIDKTVQYFEASINNLSSNSNSKKLNLIYNQEDPLLIQLVSNINKTNINLVGFGLEIDASLKPRYEGKFNSELNSQTIIDSQLVIAKDIISDSSKSTFQLIYKDQTHKIELPLNGIYNIYNALPALSIALDKFDNQVVINHLSSLKTVFGRGEEIAFGTNSIQLFLVKNPAGFDQVLQSANSNDLENSHLVILINDNIADGRDVSWLWDTNFEKYREKLQLTFKDFRTGGLRGYDMLLRFQIGGWQVDPKDNFTNQANLLDLIEGSQNQYFTVCATYTAMVEFRKLLAKKVELADIDSEQF